MRWEGLEFRNTSSDLVYFEGSFLAGGTPHPSTYYRIIVRHCRLYDGGGDGVLLCNINGTVEHCLVWDVNGNGNYMDGTGNAVVKHNEVKGAGEMSNGIKIWWCFPATVENNYIHDLFMSKAALYFANNWSGNHSIRNNVITSNNLRDFVSWHPYGGSALNVRKPTHNNTIATVNVEHNTVLGNTGHGIAWDWNRAEPDHEHHK